MLTPGHFAVEMRCSGKDYADGNDKASFEFDASLSGGGTLQRVLLRRRDNLTLSKSGIVPRSGLKPLRGFSFLVSLPKPRMYIPWSERQNQGSQKSPASNVRLMPEADRRGRHRSTSRGVTPLPVDFLLAFFSRIRREGGKGGL